MFKKKPLPLYVGLLATGISPVHAGEVALYLFSNGAPTSAAQVTLNGERATADAAGVVVFDVDAGTHEVQVRAADGTEARFEFSTAVDAEGADISVNLSAQGSPAVEVTTFVPGSTDAMPTGSIEGQVLSGATGSPIEGAVVFVEGLDLSATTDFDGNFSLRVPRGTYSLTIAHPDYSARNLDALRVPANVAVSTRVQLGGESAGGPIEEVVAVATYAPDTGTESERSAQAVLDVLDTEQLARFGDSNVASALKRVAGLTVEDNKFVVVRGLGGRYTGTTLNGAAMPSTDPTRRVVPLDLFPSAVVDQIEVQKSYTPDLPGDAAGGTVRLTTKTYPDAFTNELSLSVGYNSVATGDDVVSYDGSDTDFLGFDDGDRDLPLLVDAVTQNGRIEISPYDPVFNPGGLDPFLIESLGESFENNYNIEEETANPDFGIEWTLGNRYDLGSDSEWGFLASVRYKNEWSVQDDGVEREYIIDTGNLTLQDDFSYLRASNDIELGGMLSFGGIFGFDHRLDSNTLLVRKSSSSTKYRDGFDGENDQLAREFDLAWVERQVFIQQFLGEHLFAEAQDLQLNWRYTYSKAERDSPDRRTYDYIDFRPPGDGVLEFFDATLERRFEALDDVTHDLGVDLTLPLEFGEGVFADLKGGMAYTAKERESESLRFGFKWDSSGSSAEEQALIVNPNLEEVLSPGNIGPGKYVLSNETTASDRYQAEWDILAGYLMLDTDFDGIYRVMVGARIESSDQEVRTADFLTGAPETASLDNTDLMPAASVAWNFTDDQQLRFGYSQTVSRPDFKELSNAVYIHPEFDYLVRGNPDLKQATVDSFDLRWEWYFSTAESVSVALFYKDFDQPIEQVLTAASGTALGARTFENAESATNYGIEIDFRKEFYLGETEDQLLFVSGNYSWIDSEVELGAAGGVSGETERELQGQSPYVINLQLGYDHLLSGQKVTLLFNQAGERISDVGVGDLPNVKEQPRALIDLTYEVALSPEWTLKAAIDNLLDDEVEFTQGGKTFRSYTEGRTLSASISWAPGRD